MTDVLQAEEWRKADLLTADYLKKLKADTGKKQLAQLRYFCLYALAGEILVFHDANLSVEENAAWATLDKAISEFDGEEFVLPPHQFLSDCSEKVNFICAVKTDDRALRVTATNKIGTTIHSFDYISFDDKISLEQFGEGKIFLGGNLRKAEFNQDLSKPWVMRLFFEKGFVNLIEAN